MRGEPVPWGFVAIGRAGAPARESSDLLRYSPLSPEAQLRTEASSYTAFPLGKWT